MLFDEVQDRKENVLDRVVAPMLTQCVRRIFMTRWEVKINALGCNCFTHSVEGEGIVTLV